MIPSTTTAKDAIVAARLARVEAMLVLQRSREVQQRCHNALTKSLREFQRCQRWTMPDAAQQ